MFEAYRFAKVALVGLVIVGIVVFVVYLAFRRLASGNTLRQAAKAAGSGDMATAFALYLEVASSWNLTLASDTPAGRIKRLGELASLVDNLLECAKALQLSLDPGPLKLQIARQIEFLRDRSNHAFGTFGSSLSDSAEKNWTDLNVSLEELRLVFCNACQEASSAGDQTLV